MERNSESQAKNGNKRTARNEKNVKKKTGAVKQKVQEEWKANEHKRKGNNGEQKKEARETWDNEITLNEKMQTRKEKWTRRRKPAGGRADGGGAYLYFILICFTTNFNLRKETKL